MISQNKYILSRKMCYLFSTQLNKFSVNDMRRRGAVGARLTRNVEVVGSSPIKGPRCFLEQETLPLLFNTGWFQQRIRP